MQHDALLVLGYNNDPQDPIFQARVEHAVKLYDDGAAPQLIMSGCCSVKLDIRPSLTEAGAMADYAISLGVPASAILMEEDSVDTIGNFYYTKKNLLLACSWYNLGIVSTPSHVERSEWLAQRILGPDFEITGHPSAQPAGWTTEDIERSHAYNLKLLEESREQLQDITPGDHEAIAPFLGATPKRG